MRTGWDGSSSAHRKGEVVARDRGASRRGEAVARDRKAHEAHCGDDARHKHSGGNMLRAIEWLWNGQCCRNSAATNQAA